MTRAATSRAPRLARAQPLALLDPPTPVPVPPAWAIEAATAPATSQLEQPRDFEASRELVWARDGKRFVVRQRQAASDGGAHVYHAFELASVAFYGVAAEGFGPTVARPFGRVDTLKPPRPFHPLDEYSAGVDWLLAQQRRAREMIKALCPETVHERGEAFDGPGYITILSRPERRYALALAARRP